MTDQDRLDAIRNAADPFAAMDQHLGEIIGHKLFTLMVIDRAAQEAARIYSSHPEAYPVKGRKPLGALTNWGRQVLDEGVPYIARDAEDIRWAFFDHAEIAALGCASALNLPVFDAGQVIGTVNLLHSAGWYSPDHATRAAPFAALLAAPYRNWAQGAPSYD